MTDRTQQHDEDLIRRLDAAGLGAAGIDPAGIDSAGIGSAELDPAVPGVGKAPTPRDLCQAEGDAEALSEWARQDNALRRLYGPIADEPVPDRLAAIVGRAASAPEWHPANAPPAAPLRTTSGRARMAVAAALIGIGMVLGFGAARLAAPAVPGGTPALADAALLAHRTYAPEVAHPVEVAASDEAHMTTWLSRRLGHSLKAPDFGAEGFHLVGGRVLPDPNGNAAAMMYEDATGRRVTVYITPDPGQSETALRLVAGHGSEGYWWADHGIGCAVVGDAPRDVLKALAGKAYDAIAG